MNLRHTDYRLILLTLMLGVSHPLLAQDEGPAVRTSDVGAPTAPASTGTPTPAAQGTGEGQGTVIVGDRESPIGLYIMPWRDSSASAEMDRPARLVRADMMPIDRPVFLRELQYHRALTGALAERNLVTPGGPSQPRPATP